MALGLSDRSLFKMCGYSLVGRSNRPFPVRRHLGAKRRAAALHERVIALARSWQIEHARREKLRSPRGAQFDQILEYRGAELVIVGVVPLQKDESTGRVHEFERAAAAAQLGECLASRLLPVPAHFGKEIFERLGIGATRDVDRLQRIDRDVSQRASTFRRLTKQRQERTTL